MSDSPVDPVPLHLVGPFRDPTGFGKISREFLDRLAGDPRFACSAETERFWGGPPMGIPEGEERSIARLEKTPRPESPLVLAIGSPDHRASRNHAAFTHLMTVFEATEIPDRWKEPLARFRAVIVPSTWNARALRRAGVKNVYVAPYGVPRDTPPIRTTSRFLGDQPFTFGAIADWVPRKGLEDLVLAFTQEFRPTEPVRLVLKTSKQFLDPKSRTYWRNTESTAAFARDAIFGITGARDLRDLPSIEVLGDALSDDQLLHLITRWQAYVLPTRGEGWSLTHAQALAAGLPTIALAHGGQLDFMHEGNSYLVPFDLQPVPADVEAGSLGRTWAVCRIADLRHALREVYENFDQALGRGRAGREEMLTKWTWDRAKEQLTTILVEHLAPAWQDAPTREAPAVRPHTTVIVIAYGQLPYTRACLESLEANTPGGTEFVLIDNGSPDDTWGYFTGWREGMAGKFGVNLIRNSSNLGYPRAVNQGIERATGACICVLNNDTVVMPGWLEALLTVFREEPSAGIVAPKVLNPDGHTIHSFGGVVHLPDGTHEYAFADAPDGGTETAARREVLSAAGPCLAIARPVLEKIGLFDEAFTPGYFEDSDYCYRARHAGFRLFVEPGARIVHHGNVTSREVNREMDGRLPHIIARNQHRFYARWHEAIGLEHRTRVATGGARRIPEAHGEVVSVLTPTKNRPEYLEQTLRSLRTHCLYPPEYLHLVVVDDMSTPENRARNAQIADEMGATYLRIPTRRSFNEVLQKTEPLLEGRALAYLEHDWLFFWDFDWVSPALDILGRWEDVGQVMLKLEEDAWEKEAFADPEVRPVGGNERILAVLPRGPAPMAPHGYSFQPHVIRRETFSRVLQASSPQHVPRYLEPEMGARFHELGLRTAWIDGHGFCYHFGSLSAHEMDVELDHLRDPKRLDRFREYMKKGLSRRPPGREGPPP